MSRHALVVGGGIGGLLAAHALAARFTRVTLLERDHYPSHSSGMGPPARRGAPQSRCLHLLMAAGAAAFDDLMPGWRAELVGLGGVPFDASADAALRVSSGWLPRTRSGIETFASSRALLEDVMRRCLSRKPGVDVREGQRVVGLLGDRAGERVTGVRVINDHDREAAILADLVVDASGRGSSLPAWLDGLAGRFGPFLEETVVESDRRYVSRWFHLPPAAAPDWQCLSITPAAASDRGAIMLRAERDFWGVVLVGSVDQSMPYDDSAFLTFSARLGDDRLHEALLHATPMSPIHHYANASNRVRHYDRLAGWPMGLVAIGDAVCALDPYFGLGMTAAARGAVLLGKFLDRKPGSEQPTLEFQRELASLNTGPWRLATGRDLDGRTVERDETHIARLYAAAPSSSSIAHALLAVQHLLRPAETLMELSL